MFIARYKFANNLIKKTFNFIGRGAHLERRVNVAGIDINFVESGNGKQSLLLMPGALGSAWTDFKPQIEELPQLLQDHTIIAWDPPGYGKSIPPKRELGLDFYKNDARYAVELMKALKRPKFSVLGWSDGGITALIMAGQFPENLQKLVIWGAGAYINEDEVKALKAIRDVEQWSPRMREPMEKLYGVQGFAKLWSEWVDAAVAFYTHNKGDFCRKEVEQIKSSTFIIHGKKDPMIAAEHIPYLLKRIPDCKYFEFPDGKHNIHLRYAREFNILVTDFLMKK